MSEYLLEMKNICKSFPGVKALQNVDFQLKSGEIHALLGENGAGKSTLIKVLGGIYIAEEGQIFIDGKQVAITGVNSARANGISIIHQELVLVPYMTVAENIFMGRPIMKNPFMVDWGAMYREAQKLLDDLGVEYKINEGDGAFYGPKIDFHLQDCLGRTWQCGTIQLDMNLPERFDLTYTGADGEKHRPVMIHRVVFGSIERFIGIITEHFAGAFPVWLSPVQVKVMPITDRTSDYANDVAAKLSAAGVRVETDLRNEKIGYKIREAQSLKIPYMLVIGDREAESGAVAVRTRSGEDLGAMPLDAFIERITGEIKSRSNG